MAQEKALTTTEEYRQLEIPRISPESIAETRRQISLLQEMTREILKRGTDFGRIPGTPADSLWEPGASMIISAFNCYAGERRILKLQDDNEKVAICLEVPLISHATGRVMAVGVGAASTMESRHHYRWVDNPREWGYEDEAIETLKTREEKGRIVYRIPNPEHGELLHNLLKQASKRAEVDAAESLPGVASVLRQMFSGQAPANPPPKQGEYDSPVWQRFWGEVRRLGMTDQEAHAKLGVTSMKEWLGKGHSLDQALDIFMGRQTRPSSKTEKPIEDPFPKDAATTVTPESAEADSKPQRDPETIRTINELYKACNADWGLQPKDVLKELGISSQNDISDTPANCYRQLEAVRK